MAVLQSKLQEIRYLKRQNLEEEAKIVGNYYRDILRQFGVDCNYYKIKIPYLQDFKKIIDENTLIMHAYGQYSKPDYSVSSDMLTYMEVDSDVFQLNKYGIVPNMDVNFYFDSKDFACSLAYKLGQLKEYPIREQRFQIEVPEVISDCVEYDHDGDGRIVVTSFMSSETLLSDYYSHGGYSVSSWIRLSAFDAVSHELLEVKDYELSDRFLDELVCEKMYLSDDIFPYGIGYGAPERYESDILSGKFAVALDPYEIGKEYTVRCRAYEHGDVAVRFPSNDAIYKSFEHVIDSKDYVEHMLFLTYKVRKVRVKGEYKFILDGKLHGSILFRDLNYVGKYLEMIHPDVGDIVTIDFPDSSSRQQFEITDCFDKNLGNDGINPLLHKYVWKCKARRYINAGEDFPEANEANERIEEKLDFLNTTDEEVVKEIARYDEENSDAVYGGYERTDEYVDSKKVDTEGTQGREFLPFSDDGSYIDIFRFYDNSKLVTDGYDLYFINSEEMCYKITFLEENAMENNLVASGIRYLKATDNALYFTNFDNRTQRICDDDEMTQGEVEMCLNSLIDTTYQVGTHNKDGDHYFKFLECNTVLMSLEGHLYCRFGNKNHKMTKIC